MTIVIKRNGQIKPGVEKKLSEKWTSQCSGTLHVCPTNTFKLMVWGCIRSTYHGVGPLVFVAGNIESANTSRYWMQTYGLFLPVENNGISKTTMHRFTDLLKLKTGSEGIAFHLFFWPPQSPD